MSPLFYYSILHVYLYIYIYIYRKYFTEHSDMSDIWMSYNNNVERTSLATTSEYIGLMQ